MYLGGLCLITDRKACGLTCFEMTLLALRAGVRWVQYREKGKLYHEALRLRRLTRDFGAVFIVNDRADIALAVDADGVHLGQDDLPLREARKIMGKDKIIGISTHNMDEAKEACGGGADYIGFGPVFHTKTKEAGRALGLENLRRIKMAVGCPVVAIGGITAGNLGAVMSVGADAVAVAGGILRGNMEHNIRKFKNTFPKSP